MQQDSCTLGPITKTKIWWDLHIYHTRMSSRNSGTSSSHSRNDRRGRRSSVEDSLVDYVYALREAIDEMMGVEEALVDRINHLTVGLEGCLREVNLLHQRLNILASPPLVPIITRREWNVVPEVIIPAEWYVMHPEPPQDILHGVPVANAPPPQDIVENEPAFFLPREIEEWLNDI